MYMSRNFGLIAAAMAYSGGWASAGISAERDIALGFAPFTYDGPAAKHSVSERARLKRSKYMPHQGARECARRRRQMGLEG